MSGISFYGRKEIKDVLAYFRIIINHEDEEALLRVINYPVRGIGETSLSKLKAASVTQNTSLWNIMSDNARLNSLLSPAIAGKIRLFYDMIQDFSIRLYSSDAFELASSIVNATKILAELQQENTPESINRKENIEELLNAIQAFVSGDTNAPGSSPGGELENEIERSSTLDRFMQDIALVTDVDDNDDNPNKVLLMTIHAAKGLEFPFVYLSGLEENLFPNTLMLASQADMEEERRLFYVAVTRAQTQLTLSHARLRFRWGELTVCEPSRFLDEIDEKLLLGSAKKMSMPSYFPQNNAYQANNKVASRKEIVTQPKIEKPLSNLKKISSEVLKEKSVGTQSFPVTKDMRVSHQKFGKGTVLSVDGKGDNTKAVILFDTVGQKTLMLRFAILVKIE